MKKFFTFIAACMLTLSANAQNGNVGEFTIQPMVGITSTSAFNYSGEGVDTNHSAGYGFSVGADFGYRATDLFYPTVGAHYIQSKVNFGDEDVTTNNLAVPVLANFNVSGLRLGVGIQPTINLNKSASKGLSLIEKSADAIKNTTFAIPVVAGYEMANGLTFEFRAAYDVTKSIDFNQVSSAVFNTLNKLQTNNLTGMITIGYKFKL